MDRSRIAIIIPAFNEEQSIGPVIRECAAFGLPILVDDGSTDLTAAIAENEGAHVVRHLVNKGYDAALNSGFYHAAQFNFEYVITIDADGQHNPAIIQAFIDQLLSGKELVLGVRNKRQRLAEHCFSFFTGLMYGISDPLCGLKAYKMTLYQDLGHFDSYGSVGTELMLFSVRNGHHFKELPIVIGKRDGQPRFGRTIRANYKIFRALFLAIV
jgi:glycosyltransferase involved in cell wall biosynthesis